MSSDTEQIDVASLLTIDVSSELRKLTQAQLQGPWQLPAELVRRARRRGARRVEVSLSRHRLTIEDDGDGVATETLGRLATLMDSDGPGPERHAALTELEREGALALLAVVGLSPSRLRIVTRTPEGPRVLEFRGSEGGAPTIRPYAEPGPSGTIVEVEGARLDRARARTWVASVCRFCPADIFVDGKPIVRGFAGSVGQRHVEAPLQGTIAIPREGDDARAWLLQDGVVTTHTTITPAPCFEAAIEMSSVGAGAGASSTAAGLRDAIERHLDNLIDQAVDFMIALGRAPQAHSIETRERITQLLLDAARQRRRSSEIAQIPLFRGYERDDAAELVETTFSLLSIRRAVEGETAERIVTALFPEQEPDRYALGERVFVLDEAERSLLAELLGLRFRQPRVKDDTSVLARGMKALRRGLADLGPGIVGFFSRRPTIPDDELSPEESRFLEIAGTALGGQRTSGRPIRTLVFCRGRGRVRAGRGTLWLARDNPQVRAAVEMVRDDATWAYPALLALLGGRALPSAHARFEWTRARARV